MYTHQHKYKLVYETQIYSIIGKNVKNASYSGIYSLHSGFTRCSCYTFKCVKMCTAKYVRLRKKLSEPTWKTNRNMSYIILKHCKYWNVSLHFPQQHNYEKKSMLIQNTVGSITKSPDTSYTWGTKLKPDDRLCTNVSHESSVFWTSIR